VKLRHVLLLMGAALAGAWWWSARDADTHHGAPAPATACRLPPAVAPGQAPRQSDVPDSLRPFALAGYSLTPLAGFSIDARVLSRKDYQSGREADLSPLDLALGWDRMADDGVLRQLDISQSSRWYHYRWRDRPPLEPRLIVNSSANMHMIPGSEAAAAALKKVARNDRVRIHGWLVEARADDGWRWRSSLTREDSGGGACEVVYVCGVEIAAR